MTEKEKGKKKQTQKQLDFILPIKLATITEGGKKKKKKGIYSTSPIIIIINVFLE